MLARDARTVGELLDECDRLARETLLDVSAQQGPAMLRTWGQVVQSAARLWSVLPPAEMLPAPLAPREPDPMIRLQTVGRGIGRSVAAHRWPGPGPADERLAQIANSFEGAATLVERYGRDVTPATPEVRADIAAARSRVMHAVYVAAHGTSVALVAFQHDIRDRVHAVALHRAPASERPNPQLVRSAEVMITRLGVFEQLAGRYVAAHPVTLAALGEVADSPKGSRLQSALAAWDIQAHRSLASQPEPPDLERVARVQALIAVTAGVVTEAAAETGRLDPGAVQRLTVLVDASQVAWTQAAKRWSELRTPASRSDPVLLRAASDVRTAVAATAFTQTGWASPQEIAQRVDLPRTIATLQLAMVASVDVAYVVRDLAATTQGFTASQVAAVRMQRETELGTNPRGPHPEGAVTPTPATVPAHQLIPLPQSVRQGLVNLADEVIDTTNKAVAAAANITPSGPGDREKPLRERPGAAAEIRDVPRNNPNIGGPRR